VSSCFKMTGCMRRSSNHVVVVSHHSIRETTAETLKTWVSLDFMSQGVKAAGPLSWIGIHWGGEGSVAAVSLAALTFSRLNRSSLTQEAARLRKHQ